MTPIRIEILNAFLSGLITMGHASAGLFFLRFWTKTGDRLFVMFALAFWLLGLIRILIAIQEDASEEHVFYWFRLIAYLAILIAIVDKNVRK
ncbi:MAG: DUF5985 family protein [Planctomycetaceae bacterium]